MDVQTNSLYSSTGQRFPAQCFLSHKNKLGEGRRRESTVVFRWGTVQLSLIGPDNIVPTSASVVEESQLFNTPTAKSMIPASIVTTISVLLWHRNTAMDSYQMHL